MSSAGTSSCAAAKAATSLSASMGLSSPWPLKSSSASCGQQASTRKGRAAQGRGRALRRRGRRLRRQRPLAWRSRHPPPFPPLHRDIRPRACTRATALFSAQCSTSQNVMKLRPPSSDSKGRCWNIHSTVASAAAPCALRSRGGHGKRRRGAAGPDASLSFPRSIALPKSHAAPHPRSSAASSSDPRP